MGLESPPRSISSALARIGRVSRVLYPWNSSVLVKKSTTKGKKRQLLTPTTFCLIHFCTDFADRYDRQILPLLRAGYIVLCDRYRVYSVGTGRSAWRGPGLG